MKGWRKVAVESALLVALLAVVPLLVPTSARQAWDFETYWYAARAALTGGDPYSPDQLAHLADRPVAMPFVYPPITIPVFVPFTLLPVLDARWMWLALKLLAVLGMFQVWRRHILPEVPLVPLAFAVAFGFNAAAIWDLKTGNVSGFEQFALWMGIAAYIRGKGVGSAAWIGLASLFKLLPAAFLALLPLPRKDRDSEWRASVITVGILAALVVVPILLGPAWARGYLGNFPEERPWGYVNPSALGLIDTLSGRHGGDLLSASAGNLSLWLGYVLLVAVLSLRPLRRAWHARDPLLWVMTATPLFVLLVPRPMIYTYVLAIPAMFYLIAPHLRKIGGPYALAGILGAQAFVIPGLGMNYDNPWTSNLPFFLLLGLWALYALRVPVHVPTDTGSRRATSRQRQVMTSTKAAAWDPWSVAVIVIAALLGTGWFLFAEQEVAGRFGYSLDDSWIYATFARNLANAQGYSFNPGEVTGGATGPLYVAVLASLYMLFQDVVLPAKVLGALCLVSSSVLVYGTVRRFDPTDRIKPLLAGLLTALSPSLLWGSLSGMEIPMYLFLACLGLFAYVEQKWTLAIMAWSLGVWVRPDGLLLVLIGLFARPRESWKQFAPLAVAVVVVGSFLAFHQIIGGSPFPNSVAVKAHPGSNVGPTLLGSIRHWAGLWGMPFGPNRIGEHAIVLLPAIIVGAAVTIRCAPALALYVLGLPLAFAVAGMPWSAHARYILYVVPFGLVLAVLGLDYLSARAFGKTRHTAILILGLVCLSWQIYQARVKGILHAWNVQNIENMHRFFAERVSSVASPGDTIAVHDVGAMGFFGKCYVVDLAGLVSPRRSFPDNLTHYHPKYLAIVPDGYAAHGARDPQIDNIVFYASDSTFKYAPVAGVGLTRNTIASPDPMILFERIGRNEVGSADVPVYWR